jgi:copper chaperone CopZ
MRSPSVVPLLVLAAAATTVPLAAQLRSVDLLFSGIECASCLESLPARLQRMRGVESVKVDAPRQIVEIRLAAQNRVRLEQIRDAIEQDGTKARQASLIVEGTLSEEGGRWLLKLPNGGSQFEVSLDGAPPSVQYSLKAGRVSLPGKVTDLRPESGFMTILAKSIERLDE